MPYTRDIVLLANSIKQGRRCVAGKDLRTGEWLRPVSSPDGGALAEKSVLIRNPYGLFPARPLQIVEIPFEKPAPLSTQPENHLISSGRWRQRYRIGRSSLSKLCDAPEHLWLYGDRNDRFDPHAIDSDDHRSLYLIHVDAIHFMVKTGYSGAKKVVGTFYYRGTLYRLSVTDPAFHKYTRHDIGYEWEENHTYLCISQTDVFHGHCYKLVAAVL